MAALDINDLKLNTVRLFSEYVKSLQLATNKNDDNLYRVLFTMKAISLLEEPCSDIDDFKEQSVIQRLMIQNNVYN